MQRRKRKGKDQENNKEYQFPTLGSFTCKVTRISRINLKVTRLSKLLGYLELLLKLLGCLSY
jgi:hypothetical protein